MLEVTRLWHLVVCARVYWYWTYNWERWYLSFRCNLVWTNLAACRDLIQLMHLFLKHFHSCINFGAKCLLWLACHKLMHQLNISWVTLTIYLCCYMCSSPCNNQCAWISGSFLLTEQNQKHILLVCNIDFKTLVCHLKIHGYCY